MADMAWLDEAARVAQLGYGPKCECGACKAVGKITAAVRYGEKNAASIAKSLRSGQDPHVAAAGLEAVAACLRSGWVEGR